MPVFPFRQKTFCPKKTPACGSLWGELAPDLSVFDVVRLPADFNNLKAAIKSVLTKTAPAPYLYDRRHRRPRPDAGEAVEKNDFFAFAPVFIGTGPPSGASFIAKPGRPAVRCAT